MKHALRHFLPILLAIFAISTSSPLLARQADAREVPSKVCLLHLADPGADVVGVHIRAAHIREALRAIPPEERPDVLILRLATDGGQVAETPLLAEFLHNEILPEMRTILWIERARSAGALFAFACPEIVVTPDAIIGPARAHDRGHPDDPALVGDSLDTVLEIAERLAKMGEHDPALLQAMMIPEPSHPHPSPPLLELDAEQAVERGLAIGVAADLEALLELIGIEEYEIVGTRAGQTLRGIRTNLIEIESRMRDTLEQLENELANAERGDARPDRRDAAFIGRDIRALRHYRQRYPRLAEHLAITDAYLRERQERYEAILDAIR